MSGRSALACAGLLLGAAGLSHAAPTAPAAPATLADRLRARALESFGSGRFLEAYGRFVGLAAARYALWMCENGLALFGKDWDSAPHRVEDWARGAAAAPHGAATSYRDPGAEASKAARAAPIVPAARRTAEAVHVAR